MQREFSINIIILLVLNFLVKPLYIFAIEAGVQNLVGPTEYGRYFVLLDFVFLFIFINDAGIQNYNSRFVARNRDDLGSYFGELLGFKLFTGLLFCILTLFSGYFFGYVNESWEMLLIIIGVFFFNSVFILLRSSLSALGYYRWDSYISALDKILLLVVLGFLVWRGYNGANFELIWFPLAQLVAAVVVCIVAFALLRKASVKLQLTFRFSAFKKMVQLTFPYALILLFSAAYNRADAVMLDQMLSDGDFQAGVYAAAYRFIDAGSMVGFLFASLLLPMFANMISKKEDFAPLFTLAFKYLFIVGLLISMVCGWYSEEIYAIIYSNEYHSNSDVLTLLMASFIPVSLAHCFGSFLIADGKLKAINIIFLSGLVINVIGNFILIPLYKVNGAAIMTVFTQLFLLLGMAYFVGRSNENLKIGRLMSYSVGILLASIFVFWIVDKVELFWLFKALIGTMVVLIISWSVKWISIEDFKILKKE